MLALWLSKHFKTLLDKKTAVLNYLFIHKYEYVLFILHKNNKSSGRFNILTSGRPRSLHSRSQIYMFSRFLISIFQSLYNHSVFIYFS